jgi:hypothetical protein
MSVTAEEFLRRFLLHGLAEDFVRIRHYGLLSNGKKKANLTLWRQLLSQQEPPPRGSPGGDQETAPPHDERQQLCPAGGRGRMVGKREIEAGSHPKEFIQDGEQTA